MKLLTAVMACLMLGTPLALSAVASAEVEASAEQIGKPVGEIVELELLTSSEVVEKQKQGFINVIIANGGTEARGPHNILAGHTIMSQRTAIDAAKMLGNTLVAPSMPIDVGAIVGADNLEVIKSVSWPEVVLWGGAGLFFLISSIRLMRRTQAWFMWLLGFACVVGRWVLGQGGVDQAVSAVQGVDVGAYLKPEDLLGDVTAPEVQVGLQPATSNKKFERISSPRRAWKARRNRSKSRALLFAEFRDRA